MTAFWITLLLLQQAYSLVPVTTVQLGDPVTLTCDLPKDWNRMKLHWYKQRAGDNLKLITTVYRQITPQFEPEFSKSRFNLINNGNMSKLTIFRTTEEDEGMYHCAVLEWNEDKWSGTYLSVQGNSERTSNLTVVQWPTVSDPLHQGDLMTLQCSVLSDSENKTCPGGHSVFWLRTQIEKSHPDIIYTDGNRRDECDKRSNAQKSCVHHFSKSISSSDDGTYYCAVATCGRILFGDGTKVDIKAHSAHLDFLVWILSICLVISVVLNVFLFLRLKSHKQHEGLESLVSQAQNDNTHHQEHDNTSAEHELNYAAPNFSVRYTRERTTREFTRDDVYAQVKS
ncbi:uncharacterized protein LOC121516144 [Cheilinus undulatus]|uniref:uncharacterized protein LOC121516144 n=1 Tax=Cheilinus undulatus TaxID=241271 RepID=UPI001BD63A23|nr:uncharacterized protein LOC121516144 [Cheilinus undulatus]